ncbi:MAG: hypothetical protein R3Y51_02675 [Rikenellaceae bacterium]
MKKYIVWAATLAAIVSCQKGNELDLNSNGSVVEFSSGINTRTTEINGVDAWNVGDRVGITTSGFF